MAGGASTDPCAEDYKGVSAGDTPEAVTLSSWLKATKAAQGLKLFIDYHSYSQLFMTRRPIIIIRSPILSKVAG